MRPSGGRAHRTDPPIVPLGEFPFPLTGTAVESPYLTWIRNHSNYMAPRGLLDYVRAAAVMLRGTIINFAVFFPPLMVVAVVLGYSHHWSRANPYLFTRFTLAGCVGYVAFFAAATPVMRILVHDRALETGSDSTVRTRDRYERSFGGLLLLLAAVAGLESIPVALEWVHDRLQLGAFSWTVTLGAATAGITAVSGSNWLLTALHGMRRQVAMLLVGVIGALVPLLLILSATDYLLYGVPPADLWWLVPLVQPAGAAVIVLLLLVASVARRVFRLRELVFAVGALFGFVLIAVFTIVILFLGWIEAGKGSEEVRKSLDRIEELNAQFARIDSGVALAPAVGALVRAGASVQRDLQAGYDNMKAMEVADTAAARPWSLAGLQQGYRKQNRSRAVLAQQLRLASVGDLLARRTDAELRPLRDQVVQLASGDLRDAIDRGAGDDVGAARRFDAFVGHFLDAALDAHTEPIAGKASTLAQAQERFLALAGSPAVLDAIDLAREALTRHDVTSTAMFLGEPTLYALAAAKYSATPARAVDARVAGRDSLVALLRRPELLAVLFPASPLARRRLLLERHRDRLLRAALPRFAARGKADPRTDSATVLALLDLADNGAPRSAVPGGARVDSAYRTLAYVGYLKPDSSVTRRRPKRGPPERPSADEFAFAATEHLANNALAELDGDYMARLAFSSGYPASVPVLETPGPLDPGSSSNDKWRELMKRTGDSAFFEKARQPLDSLLGGSMPSVRAEGERSPPVQRRTRRLSLWAPAPASWPVPASWPEELRTRYLIAIKALDHDAEALARVARDQLISRALDEHSREALDAFAENPYSLLGVPELARASAARLWNPGDGTADALVAKLMYGPHATLEAAGLGRVKRDVSRDLMTSKAIFVGLLALLMALAVWCTVDVNLTSVHGLYRDRLASAFLIGRDTVGDIGIEDDLDLEELSRHEGRSVAPYHLVNVALNLQASHDVGIRDRKSDFFFFSKRFVGGVRTGYCRSERLEQAFPQIDLATAMAISAAAAAPNMGRGTSPLLVALMTMLNVRLGYWLPNPGRLEESGRKRYRGPERRRTARPPGFTFEEVFREELFEVARRRRQMHGDGTTRPLRTEDDPTVANGLVGLAFSGGGIRSASLNLGISQALHRAGVFGHCDYLSTVSGGGYLGSSLSTLMRTRERLESAVAGTVRIARTADAQVVTIVPDDGSAQQSHHFTAAAALAVRDGDPVPAGRRLLQRSGGRGRAGIAGTVAIEEAVNGDRVVTITGSDGGARWMYRSSRFDLLAVRAGQSVREGQRLVRRRDTLTDRFSWRVRPRALMRELGSRLDETNRWVNLSDGGHIENLAAMELLRRRCRYIIIGDGEADPSLRFAGLATLMRFARIDLGIDIDIDLDALRLRPAKSAHDAGQVSEAHFAIGTITYPPRVAGGEAEQGSLLYLKSSFSGDEEEPIREYRQRHPSFPHESTADQAFNEEQFEAYRALGQHIAETALEKLPKTPPLPRASGDPIPFEAFGKWFEELRSTGPRALQARNDEGAA